jgi:hypothetical protein
VARVFARRSLLLALSLGGVLAYELVPRDDRRILALLDDLCAKLTRARDAAALAALDAALRKAALPEVTLQAAELGEELRGIEVVVGRARELLSAPPLTFSLADAEAHVSGDLARVSGNLIVTERGSGEQHRDLRLTEVRLRRVGSLWRVAAVRVEPVRPAEPEARP